MCCRIIGAHSKKNMENVQTTTGTIIIILHEILTILCSDDAYTDDSRSIAEHRAPDTEYLARSHLAPTYQCMHMTHAYLNHEPHLLLYTVSIKYTVPGTWYRRLYIYVW